MNISKKLEQIDKLQTHISKEYKELISSTDLKTMSATLSNLEQENQDFKENIKVLKSALTNSNKDARSLREQLYSQLLEEKVLFLNSFKRKLTAYFGESEKKGIDRLSKLQNDVSGKLKKLSKNSEILNSQKESQFNKRIQQLRDDIDGELKSQAESDSLERKKLLSGANMVLDQGEKQPLDENIIRKRLKLNRLEHNVGIKVVGALGALIVAIGFGFLFYEFSKYNVVSCLVMGFTSALFLLLGNLAIYKKFDILGRVLLGLGSALLFSSIIYAFTRDVLPNFWWAGALSLLSVFLVIAMAIANRSQIIMSYSLIGGAIPLYFYLVFRQFVDIPKGLIDFDYNLIFGFVLLLQSGILGISLWKSWKWTKLFSYIPFLPALLIGAFNHSVVSLAMTVTTISLLLFQIAILITPIIKKRVLGLPEQIALVINTLLSSSLIFIFMDKMEKNDFMGLAAFVMIIVYALLVLIFRIARKEDLLTQLVLLSSVMVFAFSAIPMQFGAQWNMIGWSIMSLVLIFIGSRLKQFVFEIFGTVIYIISLFYFFIHDIAFTSSSHLLFGKATLLLSIYIALFSLYLIVNKRKELSTFLVNFRVVELLKGLFFLAMQGYIIYFAIYLFSENPISSLFNSNWTLVGYCIISTVTLLSTLLGISIATIPLLREGFGKILRVISQVVVFVSLFILFVSTDILSSNFSDSNFVRIIALFFTIALTFSVLINFYLMLRRFYIEGKLRYSFVWLFLGISALVWATLFNVTQVDAYGAVVSALTYAVLAVILILVGFLKGSLSVRIMGLATLLLSMAIAFVKIGWNESNIVRFFSFVAIGFFAIAIVFVYSIVDKKLKQKFSNEVLESKNRQE